MRNSLSVLQRAPGEAEVPALARLRPDGLTEPGQLDIAPVNEIAGPRSSCRFCAFGAAEGPPGVT